LKSRTFLIDYNELQLGEKIGSGSFAKVMEANWNGYRVAVKKLKNPNITETFFLREVSMIQKSHHPNVILFMGCCISPPCIITEYMAGGSLFDALHINKVKFDIPLLLKMAKDVAEGMHHLHSLTILHRDLTSKNLLLDEYQNLKIGDFGLSREFDTEMSLAGICNPRWRAPEITKGETRYDGKIDVYCFGLVLYEMLTSKLPFDELDGVTAAAKAAYESLRPTIPDDCPGGLRDLMTTCWADKPSQRPSFAEILKKLEGISKSFPLGNSI